jgi:hypothetical protein
MNTRIPRGIEVLVKKASVDPAFKILLLDRRAEAADEIGLQLEPTEAMMLATTPREQLETIIANTVVPEEHRRTFLGKAAAAMLIAAGTVAAVSTCSLGVRPNRPAPAGISPEPTPKPKPSPSRGIQPDRLPVGGIRPH